MKERDKLLKEFKQLYEERFEKLKDNDEKKLKWERISSIINSKTEEQNKKYQIKQNHLGDCYLISFLKGLMELQGKRYWKLFGTCIPEVGYYEIYFFNEKKENILIYVDDYIIVNNQFQPYFASLEDNSKYGVGRSILIEKAYAKLNGSYFNIKGSNQIGDPLFYLTGFKSQYIYNLDSHQSEELYKTIKGYYDAKDVLTTGTPKAPKIKDKDGNEIEKPFPISGIVYNHDYTVWKDFEKNDDIYIIELKNPWGRNNKKMVEFKLNLDEKHKKIEENIIKYNKNKMNSGELKIDINNYKKNFRKIILCEFSKNKEKDIPLKAESDPNMFPPEGLDDGSIENLYGERIGILDALKIEKNLQEQFLEIFKYDLNLGMYSLFKLFMTFGTRSEVFYKFMECLIKSINNQPFENNNTEDSHNSLFHLAYNVLNLLQGTNK